LCKKVFYGASHRILFWGCVKRFSPPSAAKYSLDEDIFFLILRSKIRKKMSSSKFNLARSTKKNLFTQPRKNLLPPQAAKDFYIILNIVFQGNNLLNVMRG
jgi:hypothetical protein